MTVLHPNCQGGIVFSNIVTTVSPTYAQEVRTAEVWFFTHICGYSIKTLFFLLS